MAKFYLNLRIFTVFLKKRDFIFKIKRSTVAGPDSNGIAPLRKDGQTLLTEVGKANALNDQLQSVFSPKTPISLKSLAQKSLQDLHDSGANLPFQPSPHPKMPDISIAAEGIDKLLKGLTHTRLQDLTNSNPLSFKHYIRN